MHNGYQIVFLIYSISVCLDFPYYFIYRQNKSQKVAYNPHSLEHPESHTKCALNNLNAGTIVNFKYGDRTY